MAKKKIKRRGKKIIKKKIKSSTKKIKTKRPVSRKAKPKMKSPALKERKLAGKVTHYFTNISVGVIELNRQLKAGDKISIEGSTTKFKQKVSSMQINGKPVNLAEAGKSIGLKVNDRVRQGDKVYIIK